MTTTLDDARMFGPDGVNGWIETLARDVVAGEIVTLRNLDGPYTLPVATSARATWASGTEDNPWWRLTFTNGYWAEMAGNRTVRVAR